MNPYLLVLVVPLLFSFMLHKKKNGKKGGLAIDVGGEAGYAIQNYQFTSPVETAWDGVSTLAELFEESCKKYEAKNLLDSRNMIERAVEVSEDDRSFETLHLGLYEWLSYGEAFEIVKNFSSGLAKLGHGKGECAAIFADTQAEWFLALQACFRRNITVVTIFSGRGGSLSLLE